MIFPVMKQRVPWPAVWDITNLHMTVIKFWSYRPSEARAQEVI